MFKATATNGTELFIIPGKIDGFGETAPRVGRSTGMIFVGPRTLETRESYAELLVLWAEVQARMPR